MADIGTVLATKRFGLPTWVWATLLVAVAAYVYLRFRSAKSASTTSTGSSAASTTAGVTNPSGYPVSQNFTDTTYNTNPPVQQGPSVPGPLNMISMGQYVVKGTQSKFPGGPGGTNISDNWPDGVAQIVYNIDPSDITNHAMDGIIILESNPTLIPPYANGTTVNYPLWSGDHWVPAAQTTSTTTANNTVSSASGS